MMSPVRLWPAARAAVPALRPVQHGGHESNPRCLAAAFKGQVAHCRRSHALAPTANDLFINRHIGPRQSTRTSMLQQIDPSYTTLEHLITDAVPQDILLQKELEFAKTDEEKTQKRRSEVGTSLRGYKKDFGLTENDASIVLDDLASKNELALNFIGTGYYGTLVPNVIKRNVFENPAWYTSYTPYQAEISQGRMESLLNFQTIITDLTALPVANASLLDEGTAAGEAMALALSSLPASRQKRPNKVFVASQYCHPQTLAVLRSRAEGLGIHIVTGDLFQNDSKLIHEQGEDLIGVLAQYPDTHGAIMDFKPVAEIVHQLGGTFCVATDLLALTILKPPGEFGADIAVGSSQRFGVPMGFGGPHAAFFACNTKYQRKIPGRIIGVSKDRLGNNAFRLALQTREQHIRREKATSNICTAQALLANMSAFYAIYHGPSGLRQIAERTRQNTLLVADLLASWGYGIDERGHIETEPFNVFDTITIVVDANEQHAIKEKALKSKINLRYVQSRIGISIDETHTEDDITKLLLCFAPEDIDIREEMKDMAEATYPAPLPTEFQRTSAFLSHPTFNNYQSETEILRYIHHLQSKDLSLVHSMIPLGSCTMKLNATTEMIPVSSPPFSLLHPFAPKNQTEGYDNVIAQLESLLADITGLARVSLQPNSGAQGEFTGLRVIKKFQDSQAKGGKLRDICLIPVSAHGTNPASAAMAGMRVIPLKCDPKTGNLDLSDLEAKCDTYKESLAAIMVTYPSTFGVFEPKIKDVCRIVHDHGGQVYMDGANMNAQIGLCQPGEIGADVCHLNLHKTFCIPHGGGGPGVGPIAVAKHLAPHLPSLDYDVDESNTLAISPVTSAPYGSASILPISLAYIMMMGPSGLTLGTSVALLNANYMMARLKEHYSVLYSNEKGRVAHEFILDVRKFHDTCGIEAIDIAKRLQDYGFHAPTMSWPVSNTLMIEPTESETKEELDRYCDALISIRKEIAQIEAGEQPREGNVLKMAPHPQHDLLGSEWDRPYSRETAAYPLPWLRDRKFWPSITRIDDAYGDMNLFCTCPPVEGSEELAKFDTGNSDTQ